MCRDKANPDIKKFIMRIELENNREIENNLCRIATENKYTWVIFCIVASPK